MLKIDHFSKSYGDKKAVDDLTLHIQRGGNLWLHRPQRRRKNHHPEKRGGHHAV